MLKQENIDRLQTIARTESFARAAEELAVSRPALAQQVRQWEEELGFTIFHRDHRGARLTEAGALFLREVRALFGSYRNLLRRCAATQNRTDEQLVIGLASARTAVVIPELCRAFRRRFPHVGLRFVDCEPARYAERFRRGDFDICLEYVPARAGDGEPGLSFQKLMDGPFSCNVPPGHPLAACGRVTFGMLRGRRLVMYRRGISRCHDMLRDHILRHEPEIEVIDTVGSAGSARLLCEFGDAVLLSHMPHGRVLPDFIALPTDWPFPIELVLGHHTDCRPVVRDFLRVAAELYNPESPAPGRRMARLSVIRFIG